MAEAAFTREDLARRMVHRRAVEAMIWGMPVVNYDLMRQEMLTKTAARENQVVYWGRPLDWRNQTLTPNPDTIYFMVFYNTREVGPLVVEIPPGDAEGSLNGNFVTAWQMPLEDAGLLGVDKGKGGKYLLLPPGWDQPVSDAYIPLRADTFGGFALLRVNLKSHAPADVDKAIAYGKRLKVYPLSQAASPPPTVFTDAKDALFDSTIRYDAGFFEDLDRVVQAEPWLERDRAMIDPLRTVGIEKGKSFAPSAETRATFDAAAEEAHSWMEARYDQGFPPYWDGGRWTLPAAPELIKAMQSAYADTQAYPADVRGVTYTYAYVGIKHLGAGQMYLITIRDRNGDAFDGAKTYRLRVPANPPVNQYWSVTAYDRETHALIRGVDRASRSSQIPELNTNADGSVDVFFGPKAPAGQEANWIPTDPARGWEAMFRFYGPTQALFDKAWRLSDIEKVKG